jgi:hypothetical protein
MTCHEDIQWSGGTAPYILTLAQGGGDWSSSDPSHFTAFRKSLNTQHLGHVDPGRRPSTMVMLRKSDLSVM